MSDTTLSVKDHFRFFLTEPAAAMVSIAFILLYVPRSYNAMCRLLRTWFSIQIRIWKSREAERDFSFIDEGFLRKLSLMKRGVLRKISFRDIPWFIKKKFLYPDITVHVTADFDICEERRMLRDTGTNKFKPRGPRKSGLEMIAGLEKDILNAEKEGFVRVIRYDNNAGFNNSIIDTVVEYHRNKR